jgi:hypothetical protein
LITTSHPERFKEAASMAHEEIKQTYQEKEQHFGSDESQEELGQKNQDETDFNRLKILQRDLGCLSIISSLTRVQYGTWAEEPASLVSMRFQFQKGAAELFRFEKVNITVEFTSRPQGDPGADPVVVDYGPKKLQSIGTLEDRTWHYLATLSAKANVGPVEVGPEAETGAEGRYTRHYAAVVESDDWGNRKHPQPNCIKYWLSEDKRQKFGVPLELHIAAVVTHSGPFQATVNVHADNIFHILAWPWTQDDPVLFEPGVPHGDQIRHISRFDFSTLTVDEWRQIVTPDLEGR